MKAIVKNYTRIYKQIDDNIIDLINSKNHITPKKDKIGRYVEYAVNYDEFDNVYSVKKYIGY